MRHAVSYRLDSLFAQSAITLSASLLGLLASGQTFAAAPAATIGYQPMVSEGLAAGKPFEAWVNFAGSTNPARPGYALPAGATIRVTFPHAFTPRPVIKPEATLLYGWPHKAIPIAFTTKLDPKDPRSIVIHFKDALPAEAPERPGLKSIHLQTGEINPQRAGSYPIKITFTGSGRYSGTTHTVAHITTHPVANVAAYNQLHEGRDEDWQHIKAGEAAPIPVDLLVTLPHEARAAITLRSVSARKLDILSDGKPIGTVTASGVPVTLHPEKFGPGFTRLGLARFQVIGGHSPGRAQVVANLKDGTRTVFHFTVTP